MAGCETLFPEPIIQRLQSFLTGKEAARTTLVSKSWHSAWLTRPNLDFDDTHFSKRHHNPYYNDLSVDDKFSKYAKKTIKRYEKSNLKIESFKLCMGINCYGRADLANKLIVKALRIGATRLCFRLVRSFALPPDVFGADNLVGLSVSRCKINLDDGVVIKCRRLESLMLDDEVDITANTLSNIISACPCIEKLSLLSDVYYHYVNEIIPGEGQGWDEIPWEGEEGSEEWEVQEESTEQRGRREAAAAAIAVGLVDNLVHRLRCLVVSYVSFKTLHLGDLLSRFPFLKDFTLYLKSNSISIFEEEIRISNRSIERVKLGLYGNEWYIDEERRQRQRPRVKFDVPSVRKFTFEGDIIPCLSFISTPSREWESHVSVKCRRHHDLTTFLFGELNEFLTRLSQSKTHLSLHAGDGFDYKLGDNIIQGLRKHELENLMIDMTDLSCLRCYALFDGLFRLCRPKLITQYLITQYYEDDLDKRRCVHPYSIRKTNIDFGFLCQTLEQGINIKVPSPTQFMYCLNDLEEVKAQAFDVDDVPAEWRPIPLKSLIDVDAPHEQQRVRLLLKWKPS